MAVVLICDICGKPIKRGNKFITGKIHIQKSSGVLNQMDEVCEPCIDNVNEKIKELQRLFKIR